METVAEKTITKALFRISVLCIRRGLGIGDLIREAAAELSQVFPAEENFGILIRLGDISAEYPPPGGQTGETPDSAPQQERLLYHCPVPGPKGAAATGEIQVLGPGERGRREICRGEKFLIDAAGKLLGETLRRLRAERRIRRRNMALRELLIVMTRERKGQLRRIQRLVDGKILPQVRELKTLPAVERDGAFSVLEESLRGLAGRLDLDFRLEGLQLSPREREICGFIRSGKTSKEIAVYLGLSELTVERHRHNIRRKLGLEKGQNLAAFLMNY